MLYDLQNNLQHLHVLGTFPFRWLHRKVTYYPSYFPTHSNGVFLFSAASKRKQKEKVMLDSHRIFT